MLTFIPITNYFLKIMQNATTTLVSIHSLPMHTTAFCHCTHACKKSWGHTTKCNSSTYILSLTYFLSCLRKPVKIISRCQVFLTKKKKKNDDVQNCNVSYDSSVCQMGFQQNQRSFLAAHRASCFAICWWPPASRFLCFSLLFL